MAGRFWRILLFANNMFIAAKNGGLFEQKHLVCYIYAEISPSYDTPLAVLHKNMKKEKQINSSTQCM